MNTVEKKAKRGELRKQVRELQGEVERLRNTLDSLMAYIIERELEETDFEDEVNVMDDLSYKRFNFKTFN